MDLKSRHISISVLVLITGFSLPNVLAWHENLGISNEQAAQLYKTNPQDPQIVSWQNGMQREIDAYKGLCFDGMFNPTSDHCIVYAKVFEGMCANHTAQLLTCLDNRISERATQYTPETVERFVSELGILELDQLKILSKHFPEIVNPKIDSLVNSSTGISP